MLSILIAEQEYATQYVNGSMKLTQRSGRISDKLVLRIIKEQGKGHFTPQANAEIEVFDGATKKFGGYVTHVEPEEYGVGSVFNYSLECSDYSYLLLHKNAQITYESKSLGFIVKDLAQKFISFTYGFTTYGVETGPTIDRISFAHVSLKKAFEMLANATGYGWYVDYDKDIHFYADYAEGNFGTFTDTGDNHEDITISRDATEIRNRVTVIGGKKESAEIITETFKADGVARSWQLMEKPRTVLSVKIDGVTANYAPSGLTEDETPYDFIFSYQEKYIRQAEQELGFDPGTLIEVQYHPEVPVIVQTRSTASISALSAIEGGDGVHDYTEIDASILTDEEATERASLILDEYANPRIDGTLYTRSSLATGVPLPGDLITLNMPSWGILSDTEYQIQEVETTFIEKADGMEYAYRVRFGGRLLGFKEAIGSVLEKEAVGLEVQEYEKIFSLTENISFTEGTPVMTKNTAIPKWGTAKWGYFEWS